LPRASIYDKFHKIYYDPYAGTLMFGYPGFAIYEMFNSPSRINLSEKETTEINTYLNDKSSISLVPDEFKNSAGDKNVILIIVESLEAFPLNKMIGNCEITPFFNSLINDSLVLYVPKVVSQVRNGVSSDGELLYNTGLLPLKNGAACFMNDVEYISLALILKKEQNFNDCITIHGCSPTIWNQYSFSRLLSYDRTYSKDDFNDADYLGIAISDSSLVKQSIPIITSLKQPFLLQFITASSHDNIDIKEKKSFDLSSFIDAPTARYLEVINYVDRSIQTLFNELSENNLLNNTIVLITGDHSSRFEEDLSDKQYTKIRADERFIPLIIYGAGGPYRYDDVIGQVDVYPTLLDVLGLECTWRGFGTSVFEENPPKAASTPRRIIVGDTIHNKAFIDRITRAYDLSDSIIRGNYFEQNSDQYFTKRHLKEEKQEAIGEK
jgi:phosphoglycerol transferase MdoB-like AlkP superfamily enzyme